MKKNLLLIAMIVGLHLPSYAQKVQSDTIIAPLLQKVREILNKPDDDAAFSMLNTAFKNQACSKKMLTHVHY
jgi:hypothetical protein